MKEIKDIEMEDDLEAEEKFEEDNYIEELAEDMEDYFEGVWKEVKDDTKELSKKELAQRMFVSGALIHRRLMEEEIQNTLQKMKEHPEEFEKFLKDDGLWSEDTFMETVGSDEIDKKKRTINMKHDEEMNYNCKKCKAKISAHNKDWHAEMCDKCFNENLK